MTVPQHVLSGKLQEEAKGVICSRLSLRKGISESEIFACALMWAGKSPTEAVQQGISLQRERKGFDEKILECIEQFSLDVLAGRANSELPRLVRLVRYTPTGSLSSRAT